MDGIMYLASDLLTDVLKYWLMHCLIGIVDWWIDWLRGGFIDCVVGGLLDWCIDWLLDVLVECWAD